MAKRGGRPKLLTRQELATEMGVAPGTITRWERDGMPTAQRSSRGKHSKFDLEACKAWKTETDEAQTDAALSLSAERARLAATQREKLEIDIAVRRGELVERTVVIDAGQTYTKAWTARLRGLPRQLVQAGLVEPAQETDVAGLIRELLDDISQWKVDGPRDQGKDDDEDPT